MSISEAIEHLIKIREIKGEIGIPPSLQESLNEFVRKSHGKKNMKV